MAIATKLFLVLGAFVPGALSMAATPEICVLAPHADASGSTPAGPATARVPVRRPTLFIREPLAEIRLEQGDTLLWSARALQNRPVEGPLPWPLAPLNPGQRHTLRLRPLGAAPNQFASLLLLAAPRERLTAGDNLLRSLLAGPATAWRPTIEDLLAKGDRALATALLFASEGPNEPALNALRLQAAQTSCP